MLTDRELLILEEIVQEYTENGKPIGSKTVMNNLPIKLVRPRFATIWLN